MVTIEILDLLGYPKVFYPPTILIVTIEILDILGYPKVFYPPTILIVTIDLLDNRGYCRVIRVFFDKYFINKTML